MNKKTVYIVSGIVAVVALLVLATLVLRTPPPVGMSNSEPYRAALSGEYVCLPKVGDGPHTMDCAFGVRLDSGEYYAVDFALMSQEHREIEVGERFSANGLITPIERLSTDNWRQYDIKGIFSVTDSLEVADGEQVMCTMEAKMCPDGSYVGRQGPNCEFAACPATPAEPVACTMEAKICPDGTAVGRQGPNCEFAACPSEDATYATLTTFLGGTATTMNVTVSPQEVVSDSRCPKDVQCVWAGTVEVRTVLSTQVSHGEHVLTLGAPQTFGNYTVTLVSVTPEKTVDAIPESSYRFTFDIKKIR